MKYIPKQLENLGIEGRFALDISSVIMGVRPRGLVHVSADLQYDLKNFLSSYGLRVEATRKLYRENDSVSREGVLNEKPYDSKSEEWCEVWYSNAAVAPIDQMALFQNPGKFLGYPECCRKAMENKDPLARLYQRYLSEESNRYWELNRLTTLFYSTMLMPDFFPCSMSCEYARKYVVSFHDVANYVFNDDYLFRAKSAMRAPITIIGDKVIHWSEWKCDKERLWVSATGAKKESIDRISSYLSICETSAALLVSFNHLFEPVTLTINLNECDVFNLPLKLI